MNQSKASAPTRWPAASAMTWLLADDPRLRKEDKVVQVPPDLGTCYLVAFEKISRSRPPVEQTAHPDPGNQP